MDNTTAAYIAIQKFAKAHDDAYVAKATESQRNAKHFDIGLNGGYHTPERDALLQTFGFKDDDEFYAAVELTDWKIAYNKFNKIFSMLPRNSTERIALIAGITTAGFWSEEDHNMDGPAMYAIAKAAAPKYAQLIELTEELGFDVPRSWTM